MADVQKFKVGSIIFAEGSNYFAKIVEIKHNRQITVIWNIAGFACYSWDSFSSNSWKLISDEKEILQYLIKHG